MKSAKTSAYNVWVLFEAGHLQRNRWKAYELGFVCWSGDHLKSYCLFKKAGNIASIQLTHSVPSLGKNPEPTDRRTLLWQQAYSQAQKRPKVRIDGRKKQPYKLTERKSRYRMEQEQEGMPNI